MAKIRSLVSLIVIVLTVLCFAFASAQGVGNETKPPYKVGGDLETFAAGANLATVTIDKSKLKRENLDISFFSDHGTKLKYDPDTGEVRLENAFLESSKRNIIGQFTITFPGAAILSNGERKALIINSGNISIFTMNDSSSDYYDTVTLLKLMEEDAYTINIMGKSKNAKRTGIRQDESNIKVEDAADGDTFLFTVRDINIYREGKRYR